MRKFGLCLFYGLCVFTIAFSLFWMALPRLPLPEAPADETPPISGSVSSLVQAAAPTAAGYYLCDTGGRVAVYACNADGNPGVCLKAPEDGKGWHGPHKWVAVPH